MAEDQVLITQIWNRVWVTSSRYKPLAVLHRCDIIITQV